MEASQRDAVIMKSLQPSADVRILKTFQKPPAMRVEPPPQSSKPISAQVHR